MADRDVDLLAEEYAEQWPEDSTDDAARLARAYLLERFKYEHEHKAAGIYRERLEADEARLAAVAALADEWEADRGILSPDSRYTRDVLVRELRAALAPDAAPSPGVEGCSECGHRHTPEGCTGDPTPSDRWAGVPVSACDCASPAPTPAAPTDEGARLGEGHQPVTRGPNAAELATYCRLDGKPWPCLAILADRARGLGGDQQGEEAGR